MSFSALLVLMLSVNLSIAQTKEIHYWHFNNFTTVSAYKGLPAAPAVATVNSISPFKVNADYSILDSTKANIVYKTQTGVSAAFSSSIDYVNPGTSLNATTARVADTSIISYGLRPRNRSDSMELLFYIPTTGFQNIKFSYAAQISSTTSGMRENSYDYSVDSGLSWKTIGLSHLTDSGAATWGPVFTVGLSGDTLTNNNDKLVFRIRFFGNNTGTSGNVRFDNVLVLGDTIPLVYTAPKNLVHYWHFNTFDTNYHNPNIPSIHSDWSVMDPFFSRIDYSLSALDTGYLGYIDYCPGDVINTRTILAVSTPAGNGYRFRNPADSAHLTIFIPSLNHKDLELKFANQTSSFATGILYQHYSYSTDSGTTWKTSGLNITDDTLSTNFRLITINFGADTTVNDNIKLAFKIEFSGNTAGLTGNNRFDNFTLDGTILDSSYVYPTPPILKIAHSIVNEVAPLNLYPNPVKSGSELHFSRPISANIYSLLGQKVFAFSNSTEISLPILPSGVYVIKDVATNQINRLVVVE
ncbi:MAG: T9SS type A sorting domain-containing protein [Chitinophagaceae bacterium]|nr:T9SS type A sorting domain-containing protein [Chitinophagaceae bacterium]